MQGLFAPIRKAGGKKKRRERRKGGLRLPRACLRPHRSRLLPHATLAHIPGPHTCPPRLCLNRPQAPSTLGLLCLALSAGLRS